MMINHAAGLLFRPTHEWQKIADRADRGSNIAYFLVLALLPALAWYYGTTQIGWSVGDGEVTRLTADSALRLIVLFYLAMVVSIIIIGYSIHWMAVSYGATSTLLRGISVAGFTATPLLLAGAIGFSPVLWAALVVGIVAVSWSLYLLYTGIPIVMHVPEDRGFLFASAVVAVCLVILIGIMGASVILWDIGFAPEYTN
jgi:hypothetical protein